MTLMTDFVAGRTPAQLYETYLAPGLFMPWAERLVAFLPPSGHCVDLACGTGAVSRTLADHPNVSHVDGVDVAPPMVELADKLVRARGQHDRVTLHRAGAGALPFEDARFDTAYCQQGIQFFPDRLAALAELRRVMRPGAHFAATVWTPARDGNPVFAAFEQVVADQLGNDLVPFGPFAFGDSAALGYLARDAGFEAVELTREEMEVSLPDARTLVLFDVLFLGRPAEDGALQPVIDPHDGEGDARIEALIAALESATASFRRADGTLRSPMCANVLRARA